MEQAQLSNLLGALSLALADAQQTETKTASSLSASACAVLVTLGPYPGSTIGAVAGVLGLTHSVAVRLVDDLVRAGLIERGLGTDRRQVALRLTPKGVTTRRAILEARNRVLADALAALDADEQRLFGDMLSAMLTRLTRSREKADHMCRLCDEEVCDPERCPVEQEAVRLAGEKS
jgi:DNA-binding MarR family transcriptional regulator